jgi:hypothetical protein
VRDMVSMAARFASWDALRVSLVTSSTEWSPICQRKHPQFFSKLFSLWSEEHMD